MPHLPDKQRHEVNNPAYISQFESPMSWGRYTNSMHEPVRALQLSSKEVVRTILTLALATVPKLTVLRPHDVPTIVTSPSTSTQSRTTRFPRSIEFMYAVRFLNPPRTKPNPSTIRLDTDRVVHPVLTNACDSASALWWMRWARERRREKIC